MKFYDIIFSFIQLIINAAKKINTAIAINPQNGEVTHHQDQSITLHNFKVINTTPSSDKTDMPELELFAIVFYF